MKYDEIILECLGDCDNCRVFLECQYQTSTGKEKAEWLAKLEERDNNLKQPLEAAEEKPAEDVSAEGEVVTENPAENADAVKPDSYEAATENEAAAEECQQAVSDACECTTREEAPVNKLAEDEVNAIFAQVFGESFLKAIDFKTEKITENEAPVEECQQAVTDACECTTREEAPVNKLTEDEVNAIFAQVFGESFLKPAVTAAVTENEVQEPSVGMSTQVEEAPAEPAAEIKKAETPKAKKAPAKKQADEDESDDEEEIEEEEAEEEEPEEEEPEDEDTPEEEQADSGESSDGEENGNIGEQKPVKEVFKLTPPENNEELLHNMCAKRQRKLIYRPNEVIIAKTFKVLGTDKKNDIGEKVKDILDAEIKQGVKLGYLDKFDGLKSSEIKEEYEDDVVYEYAEQEFKKTGIIYDGKEIKVYLYDWDTKACHHVGHVDPTEGEEILQYLKDKENYSFDVCGIITGGKAKRVVRVGDALKIVKEKGENIGLDVDVAIIKRKD